MTTVVYVMQRHCYVLKTWLFQEEFDSLKDARFAVKEHRQLTSSDVRIIKRTIKDEVIK